MFVEAAAAGGGPPQIILGIIEPPTSASTIYQNVMNGCAEAACNSLAENDATGIVPTDGTFDEFQAFSQDGDFLGAGETTTVTLRIGPPGSVADTAISCVMDDTNSSCTDGDAVTVSAGDLIVYKIVQVGTAAANVEISTSLQFTSDTANEFIAFGSCNNDNNGALRSCSLTGRTTDGGATSESRSFISPWNTDTTGHKFYAHAFTAPGTGNQWTITLNDLTTSDEINCVISGTGTDCNTGVDTVTISLMDRYNVNMLPASSPDIGLFAFGLAFINSDGEFPILSVSGNTESSGSAESQRFPTGRDSDVWGTVEADHEVRTNTAFTTVRIAAFSQQNLVGDDERNFALRDDGSSQINCTIDVGVSFDDRSCNGTTGAGSIAADSDLSLLNSPTNNPPASSLQGWSVAATVP